MDKALISIMLLYYLFIVALMFYMFKKRTKAIKNKEVKFSHFKAYQGSTPEYLVVIQNHFNNQFQLPIIFFIVTSLIVALNKVSLLAVVLASLFLISRLIHTYIHLGSNKPLIRAIAYFVGVIIVAIQWSLLLI